MEARLIYAMSVMFGGQQTEQSLCHQPQEEDVAAAKGASNRN